MEPNETTTAPTTEATQTAAVNTAAPKKAAKKAMKKASKKVTKKLVKKAAKKAPKAATVQGAELTGNEVLILAAMVKAGDKPLSRKQLAAKTGINKGWSRTLGASTKDDCGAGGSDSLEGRGLIKAAKEEENRFFTYTITAAGRKLLAKVQAAG